MRLHANIAIAVLVAASAHTARADDEPAPRAPDTPWKRIVAGPFASPRLFQMPVAHTVGAFVLSLSYDGSLLQEPGVLSSAGVAAIGVGDIAQLEYRHTSAISIDATSAPVPAVGVQIVLPLPDRRPWPTVAGAFRLGVPRREHLGDLSIDEAVTDLYAVTEWRLPRPIDRLTVHAGVRLSRATIEISGGGIDADTTERLILPSGGLEWRTTDATRVIAEVGLVPRFVLDPERPDEPAVDNGVQGRLGVRWYVHPIVSIDASLGYQVEAAHLRATAADDRGAGAVVDWDIRLGGELFVPWGAIACRSLAVFCE